MEVLHELRRFQEKQGLMYSVPEDVEVHEIICEISSTEHLPPERHLKNQENFKSGVVSMDIEDVKASYYDVMHMNGGENSNI